MLVTGWNRELGISDEWFSMGDSLVLTVLGQVCGEVARRYPRKWCQGDDAGFVYALLLVNTYAGDFLATGYLTSKKIALAKGQLRALFVKVRPNAVALVDAFDHTDHYLGSILGRFDGDVHTHLYEDTKKNCFNDLPVTKGYESYLRPLLKSYERWACL